MPTEIKEPALPDQVDELVQALPPHLRENFETAEKQIIEYYGMSPGMPALMRLWIASGTSWRIRRAFECAVLKIERKTLNPTASGEFDEDCL
ncbi:MAG: hypothetical protein Q8N18_25985 [Opitutaceae bacterium]|nr:hypothetical protein [Opitutaceae bacterium]